ncbi:hypothetical protein ACUHGC_08985 [Testudinibacter sp. P27/CKL/0425]
MEDLTLQAFVENGWCDIATLKLTPNPDSAYPNVELLYHTEYVMEMSVMGFAHIEQRLKAWKLL